MYMIVIIIIDDHDHDENHVGLYHDNRGNRHEWTNYENLHDRVHYHL